MTRVLWSLRMGMKTKYTFHIVNHNITPLLLSPLSNTRAERTMNNSPLCVSSCLFLSFSSHHFSLLFKIHLLPSLNPSVYLSFPPTELRCHVLLTSFTACISAASTRSLAPHFKDLATYFRKHLIWRGQEYCLMWAHRQHPVPLGMHCLLVKSHGAECHHPCCPYPRRPHRLLCQCLVPHILEAVSLCCAWVLMLCPCGCHHVVSYSKVGKMSHVPLGPQISL